MNAGTEEIREGLSLLFLDGAVVELRALGDGGVHSGYFTDFDALAGRANAMDTYPGVQGIYVTVNEVNPALLSRRANRVKQRLSRSDATTADADICRRRWLPIDLDPVRPSGVSATDAEHAAALKRAKAVAAWLTGRGFPAPILADSGNGAHLLYRIDLPNDGEATRLVKGCLAVLDAVFSDETVHCDTANFNAGRIWKCYGTTARKGDNTGERPHRKARILSAPDAPEVVPDERLRELAGSIPRSAPAAEQGRRRGSFDLRRWLDTHHLAVRTERPWQGGTLFSLAACPFSTAHRDGAFAIQFANGAVFAGCHHDSCGGGTQRWQELRAQYEPERAAGRQTPGTEPSNDEEEPLEDLSPAPSLPDTTPEQQEHRKRATEILEHGDPLAFLLDVFHRDHVGDRTVAECLAMSVASQSVENTAGLHVAISGNSGKGKTHACNAMLRLLPEAYRLKGTVSNKALFYYDDLLPGTVILFDDISLSDDMQELLKSATANFQEPVVHRTLTRDRQLKVCTIPERCVWWLAKVEAVGDDQVMNRMLTVWIDDSSVQDQAVLAHLKKVEAGRVPSAAGDPDVPVCREIWKILKQAVRHVCIPFACRINFSAAHNRRNPAMLFDLIKCHAVLNFLQREKTDDGTIIATHADFVYARQLFIAINGNVGGQETKLTRNESSALATITRMDLRVFTIRQLQDTLGLSYYQTYRLLHGYSNSRTTYLGLLDKCPAVSLIDATVAEEICGVECRRREHYFSFDLVHYRGWSEQADVWLGEGDDDDRPEDDTGGDDGSDGGNDTDGTDHSRILSPAFHQKPEDGATKNGGPDTPLFSRESTREERRTESMGTLYGLPVTPGDPAASAVGRGSVYDPDRDAKIPPESLPGRPIEHSGEDMQKTQCKPDHNGFTGDTNVQGTKGPGTTPPLPGILDHTSFHRSSVSLGHCTICGEGAAVYHSREQRASICEGCYARMIREWNKGEGVV
ncbi:hypothetical protein L1S32_02175 [Methanogenium sp. S4BF]|uniref:hypothetical protein n=1 Tax=Methanogenium sp. S4BF TaxID=1789226 RepID=UPI002416C1A4|nr:hypothetical protein [Methanogenium sp. S4BF]WFN34948.1 hypothetical protein L1S32_02175 [Methanogenium sp. S4BF]